MNQASSLKGRGRLFSQPRNTGRKQLWTKQNPVGMTQQTGCKNDLIEQDDSNVTC